MSITDPNQTAPKKVKEDEKRQKKTKEEEKRQKEDLDRKLDEQLEESFPASDPPGYIESDDE